MSFLNYFNRIRRFDSLRDQLIFLFFFNIFLRSVQDCNAFQNMITLCEKNLRIIYRSSSRFENDRCSIFRCAQNMNRFIYFFFLIFRILDAWCLIDQMFFDFTKSTLLINENIFIVVIRTILKENMILSNFVFNATNESSLRSNNLSIINVISTISTHF